MIRNLVMLGILTSTFSLTASVTVGPGDRYTVDSYGDSWQKKPMDKDIGGTKHLISRLSKKKTSDIIIYPTPRK